jgi:hypothetical protein
MPDNTVASQAADYNAVASQENAGTGFASPLQQPYPSQAVQQRLAEQQTAAQARAIDAAAKKQTQTAHVQSTTKPSAKAVIKMKGRK